VAKALWLGRATIIPERSTLEINNLEINFTLTSIQKSPASGVGPGSPELNKA
jgi:hypothetical protein